MESPRDGADSNVVSQNPSPIVIKAKINNISMSVMFDSGSTKSFIQKAALLRTQHLPIRLHKHKYTLADGHTTMEVMGTVRICIDLHHLKTSIIADVVDSLCTDCILGMDYINKYKVNLDNKQKLVQIFSVNDTITMSMIDHATPSRTICRLERSTYFKPFQEKRIKVFTSFKTGDFLFSPAFHMGHIKRLIIPHSFVHAKNHVIWFSVYNTTNQGCYLKPNTIIGTLTSISNNYDKLSLIFDPSAHEKFDENQSKLLSVESEKHIDLLINHLDDQEHKHNLKTKVVV